MYEMGSAELMQYVNAEMRYEELCRQQVLELHRAYADIHPTRMGFDFDQGKVFSESVNVEDYAIFLVDLKADHQRQREWWAKRIRVYRKALALLPEAERMNLLGFRKQHHDFYSYDAALQHLYDLIEEVVTGIPELHRKQLAAIPEEPDDEDLDEEDYMADYVNYIEDETINEI